MREEDVSAVHETATAAFAHLDAQLGQPPHAPPDPAIVHIRHAHLVRTDPEGAWVAEDERGIAGCALAIRRENVWGLSLLIVRPDVQSAGVGTALLNRANEYAAGARGRIILSSPDPRALRAYARLGLEVHPSLNASGVPRDVPWPDGIREGDHTDIPLTEAVDRHVRGAAHGADIGAQLDMGQTLLIAPERGYAVTGEGELRLLAAFDDEAASDLLRAVLAMTNGGKAMISWITSTQQWAARVSLEAGLELSANAGAVFVDGDVGPFRPYLPSGAFL